MDDFDPNLDFGDLDDIEEFEDDYCFECQQYIDEDGLCGCVDKLWIDVDGDEELDFLSDWNQSIHGTRLG